MRNLIIPVLLALLALPAASPAAVLVGIGDQKADMFSDPRFLALSLNHARRSIAWDALEVRSQTKDIDGWLNAARTAGVSPLIGFDHSRRGGRAHHRKLPTASQFRHEFRMFHARYPWVRDFATWNEANYCGEPTCHHPEAVAAYYRVMRSVCPHCNVLGAELLDVPGMVDWVRAFRRAARVDPHLWGLHNYVGANRFQSASTRALLRATHGDVWFTEIAGLVARRNHSAIDFPENEAHAADVTRFVFDRLARLSPRVKRVYLYEWDASTPTDSWDSALIGLDGMARKAYGVLARILLGLGVKPHCPTPGMATSAQFAPPPTCADNSAQPPSSGSVSGSRVATK